MSERIENLKKYLREKLPYVSLEYVDEIEKSKNILGTFNSKEQKIRILKEQAENERVLAHEIVHAIEKKRYGKTSHRNIPFWSYMSRELDVPLVLEYNGKRTVRGLEFKEWIRKKRGGKFIIYCANCSWEGHYRKERYWFNRLHEVACPKCHQHMIQRKDY